MKNRSNSLLSLPKINQVPEQEEKLLKEIVTKRQTLIKQFFRPKWGLAPKCLVKGHQGKDIMYICINKQCKQVTRLICEQCFFKNHANHNTECLAIDEIKLAKIQKLRYWPFAEQFRKMYEFVAKHQSYVSNIVQDVNASFNEMAVRIMTQIDKMRLNMLKKIDTFYIKETTKKQFAQNLKVQLQQTFDLKRIQSIVNDLFNKKIKHSVFQNQITNLLNDSQMLKKQKNLLQFFNKSQKGVDIQFDKQIFIKKEKFIIDGIKDQQLSLKHVDVVIGDVKEMQKIIPQSLKYLSISMKNFKELEFETKILQDTSQYTGFFSKGVKNLIGMRKYKSGAIYYGQWLNDTRHGWGMFDNKTASYKYVGNWRQDRKNGYGRQQSTVTIYEGEFVQDKKQGFGVLIKDGNRYQINWKQDKMNGEGKVIQPDGLEHPIYYVNGIQTETKKQKVGGQGAMSLTELTKRFTKSTKAKSIISNTKST